MMRTALATVGTLVGIAALGLAPANAATTPAAAVTLNSQHLIAVHDLVVPLAGSSSYLAYVKIGHPYAGEGAPSTDEADGLGTLHVRTSKGAVSTLGHIDVAGSFDAGQDSAPNEGRVSIVGDSLSTPVTGSLRAVSDWNLVTATRRVVTVPAGDTYESAAPDGIVYSDSTGTLYDEPAAGGAAVLLGQPFPSAPGLTDFSVTAGPDGVVATDASAAAYLEFAHPGIVVALDNPDGTDDFGPHCASPSATAVACGTTTAISTSRRSTSSRWTVAHRPSSSRRRAPPRTPSFQATAESSTE